MTHHTPPDLPRPATSALLYASHRDIRHRRGSNDSVAETRRAATAIDTR